MKKVFLTIISVIISIYFLAIFVLSAAFIAGHADHAHSSADCSVCQQISECEKILHRNFSLSGFGTVCAALSILFVIVAVSAVRDKTSAVTLVSLKVELLN